MYSRAKRGICFSAILKKKQIPRANRALGTTLFEFFRNLLSLGIFCRRSEQKPYKLKRVPLKPLGADVLAPHPPCGSRRAD